MCTLLQLPPRTGRQSLSLQTQQDQNRSFAFIKRLQRFTDNRAGSMHDLAAHAKRLRLHCHARRIAADKQISDVDWMSISVNSDFDAPGGCDQDSVRAAFTQDYPRLRRYDTGDP